MHTEQSEDSDHYSLSLALLRWANTYNIFCA